MSKKDALSDVDRRILMLLLNEGAHLSEQEIADKLKLSQTTVNYKLSKLFEKNIIRNTYYRLNPVKFGLAGMAWVFIKLNRDADFGKVRKGILGHQNVFSIKSIAGGYDLLAKVNYEGAQSITHFILWLEQKFKNELEQKSLSMVLHKYKLHKVILDDEKYHLPTKITKLDKDILRLRLKSPEISIKNMAKKLKVHRNTVAARWNRLLREKVIIKKGIDIDPYYYWYVGIDISFVVLIDVKTGRLEEAAKFLSKFNEVQLVTSVSSLHDLLCIVKSSDVHTAHKFMRKLYLSDSIKKTRSMLVFTDQAVSSDKSLLSFF